MSHRNKDTLARRASFAVAHFLVGWPQSQRNAAELKPEALAKALRLNGPSLALQASIQALFRHISLKCATSKRASEGLHLQLFLCCSPSLAHRASVTFFSERAIATTGQRRHPAAGIEQPADEVR